MDTKAADSNVGQQTRKSVVSTRQLQVEGFHSLHCGCCSNLLCRATSRQRRWIDMEMWKLQGTKPGRGDDMLEVLVPVKVQGINASGDLVVFFPQAA